MQEEMEEFRADFSVHKPAEADRERAMAEFGDLLFSLINYARFLDINPEEALERTNKKFIHRFRFLEEAAARNGKKLAEMSLEEMDVYWNEAKELNTK